MPWQGSQENSCRVKAVESNILETHRQRSPAHPVEVVRVHLFDGTILVSVAFAMMRASVVDGLCVLL
jgi:hypothetical protein